MKDILPEIANNFNLLNKYQVLVPTVIVIFLLLLALIINKVISRRRNKLNPIGIITDTKQIHDILAYAFDHRCMFDVQIKRDSEGFFPNLRCSPEQLGRSTLSLEVNGINSVSDSWLYRDIILFFRIKIDDNYSYYMAETKIVAISRPKRDLYYITLETPTVLENKQKRSFLRMPPPSEFILGGALWIKPFIPEIDQLQDISLWPYPPYFLIPKSKKDFTIIDISTGGIRISIPKKSLQENSIIENEINQVIILLDLYAPDKNTRLRFWVQCKVKSFWEREDLKEIHMGLQFIAWAMPKAVQSATDSKTSLQWLRLSSSYEVDIIGKWIMQRHLELLRDFPFNSK